MNWKKKKIQTHSLLTFKDFIDTTKDTPGNSTNVAF